MSLIDEAMTERKFQALVNRTFSEHGFLVYHTHDSRRSEPGFPDTVMVKNGVVIFAELKREKGRVSPAQARWLKALEEVSGSTPRVKTRLWKPSDWPEILATAREG